VTTADDDAASEASLVALASRLQEACLDHGLTVSVAESCTGGLVGHVVTEIPGSSGYFRGGTLAYANEVKERELGVGADVLSAHGAVSAQTARAMAVGLRRRFRVDLAGAVTGIAGPGGGSPAKPIGLTYVAVADERGVEVRRHVWPFGRSGNKRASAAALLLLLIECAAGAPGEGPAEARDEAPAQAAASTGGSTDPSARRTDPRPR
jgi:PncC family amidohydrolase